ncbi:MAG: RluA family pseudouridine synthase [Coriobacteriales bacterium]|jgi:23S rRNA pseudouridine1911/1915/1917 synthase|nr:RluA family pseudouridine synthase [Coriobacteriales bacterium]
MSFSTLKIDQNFSGMRLDAALAAAIPELSRSEAVRLIEEGWVQLNGTVVTAKKRLVLDGDCLNYELRPAQPEQLFGEHIELDIRYEDEHIIVLSKQAGLVVHPAHGHDSGTLVHALIYHYGYENLALLQGEDRPGIVHRLDKDTSGLMLAAKTNLAGEALQLGIRDKEVKRRYKTLVHGYIAANTGMIDAAIDRGGADRQRMVVSDSDKARPSQTDFTVLQRFESGRFDDGYTLLECRLHTGRTHQIRVHMEYIGHPCVGDMLYGTNVRRHERAHLGLERQFLHSWFLRFSHPITGELMEFTDDFPDDLREALKKIEDRKM